MGEMEKGPADSSLDLPEGFKMTELGPLPEDWDVVRLGEVTQATAQVDPRKMPEARFKYIDVSAISNTSLCIQSYKEYLGKNAPSRARKQIASGDVLFATVRPYLRRVALVPPVLDCQVCSTAFCVIRAKPGVIDNYYLFLAVSDEEFVQRVSEHQRGSSYPAVTDADVLGEVIPLPPLPEQRAIARVLRTVQRAKEATERVIQATRELKKSLMRHLFTYGPVPVGEAERMPLKETEIGLVPEHWNVVRLWEVIQETSQIDPGKKPDWRFRYVDVSSISNQVLRIHSYTVYKGANAPSRARKLLKAGDVIFATVRPSLKRVALVPSELDGHICSTAFCIMRPKPQIADNVYVFFAVSNDNFVHRVSTHQRGSSYPAVTDTDVLEEFVPLPPLPEQCEIARILRTVDKKLQAEETRKQALEVLFKTLLHNLMTGRIRVKGLALPETKEVV